jgi:hypothetical protein
MHEEPFWIKSQYIKHDIETAYNNEMYLTVHLVIYYEISECKASASSSSQNFGSADYAYLFRESIIFCLLLKSTCHATRLFKNQNSGGFLQIGLVSPFLRYKPQTNNKDTVKAEAHDLLPN